MTIKLKRKQLKVAYDLIAGDFKLQSKDKKLAKLVIEKYSTELGEPIDIHVGTEYFADTFFKYIEVEKQVNFVNNQVRKACRKFIK